VKRSSQIATGRFSVPAEALEQVAPKSSKVKVPRWKLDADLLAWLDSL
jgi:hypothetical protein